MPLKMRISWTAPVFVNTWQPSPNGDMDEDPAGRGVLPKWIGVVICQPADDAPNVEPDARLIERVLQHIGLCVEVVTLFNQTEEEVLHGLDEAAELMKQHGAKHLFVCYFGHGWLRRHYGSTWMQLKDLPLSLECSVRSGLRKADLKWARQVIIADCCQNVERSEFDGYLTEGSEEALSDRFPQHCLYAAPVGYPTGDTGHFAAALAYCLLCRLNYVANLFEESQHLVSELTCFRQECQSDGKSEGKLCPLVPDRSLPLHAIPDEGEEKKVRDLLSKEKLFFLARWLCELSGNELCKLCALEPTVYKREIEDVIKLFKEVLDLLKQKADLFKGSLWFHQLNLIYDCKDLSKVRTWLQERSMPAADQDVSEEQLCRPCHITPDIQNCLLEIFKEVAKDEFDKDLPDDREGPIPEVEKTADLWERLSKYFHEYDGTPFETDEGKMKCTYAIYMEGVKGIEHVQDQELRKIASEINELSEVFDTDTRKYRVFLRPGSLWIIIRSDTRLQHLKEFMDGLAKWQQQRCGGETRWKGAKAPRRVPLGTVPERLLNLVLQVENCFDFGSCTWLRAEDVQMAALKRLNDQRDYGNRLEKWQVAVFDGHIEAKGKSWLEGYGQLRLVVPRQNWIDLNLPANLRKNIMELAVRRTWQQDFTFHAAVFVMHITWEQNNFATRALSFDGWWLEYQTPQDLLKMLFREALAVKSAHECLEDVAQDPISSQDLFEVVSPKNDGMDVCRSSEIERPLSKALAFKLGMASGEQMDDRRALMEVVMPDTVHPINILVVGGCGQGKSTLIDSLRLNAESPQPAIGRNPRGVTKKIMMYPCPDLCGSPLNLIDTPGVGDWDCTVIQLVSMIEAFLTEGMVPGGIRGVVVALSVNDARINLGAQIVQAVVDKGVVAAHAGDKYANIILCGTKVDKADPEDITNFLEGLDGAPSVRSLFFENSPNKTGLCALVDKANSSKLLGAILNLPCTSIAFQKPESRVMAQALASKLGMEPEEFESQMDGMRAMVQAQSQQMKELLQQIHEDQETERKDRMLQEMMAKMEEDRRRAEQARVERERQLELMRQEQNEERRREREQAAETQRQLMEQMQQEQERTCTQAAELQRQREEDNQRYQEQMMQIQRESSGPSFELATNVFGREAIQAAAQSGGGGGCAIL